jgi:hypothetical protein
VVRNFMPESLLHQAFQILAVASHPFVRTLEYRDLIGQMKGFKNATMRQGLPFIQSEEGAARRNSSRFKLIHRRLIFDHYGYVIHAASESRGNVAKRPFHNLVEILREDRVLIGKAGHSGIVAKKREFGAGQILGTALRQMSPSWTCASPRGTGSA